VEDGTTPKQSNLAAVIERLNRDVGSVGFLGRGRDGMLADDVRKVVSEIVIDRTVLGQKDPDLRPLEPLQPSTVRKKLANGFPDTILVETKEMLAQEQLMGELALKEQTAIDISYGTNDDAKRKAYFAHTSYGSRPERPFYAIGEGPDDQASVDMVVSAGLDAQAREIWGGYTL
jgi:hypothetical protein